MICLVAFGCPDARFSFVVSCFPRSLCKFATCNVGKELPSACEQDIAGWMALWIGVEDHDFMIGCDRLLDNPLGIASSSSSSITDRHFATRVAPHGMFPRYQSLLFRSLPLSLPLSFPSSTNHRIHNSDLSLSLSLGHLARSPAHPDSFSFWRRRWCRRTRC